jgi:hypothetical protein
MLERLYFGNIESHPEEDYLFFDNRIHHLLDGFHNFSSHARRPYSHDVKGGRYGFT